jgi:hypothetical protein
LGGGIALSYILFTFNTRSIMFIDVLGRLKAIQPVEKVLVRGQELEDKREFILENIRFVKDSFFFNGM